jgi:hypothetical protein
MFDWPDGRLVIITVHEIVIVIIVVVIVIVIPLILPIIIVVNIGRPIKGQGREAYYLNQVPTLWTGDKLTELGRPVKGDFITTSGT